jgi:hypothetical protein
MKKILLGFILIFSFYYSNGQQFFAIKEAYDQLTEPYYTTNSYNYFDDSKRWWENWGNTLLGYLRMYQATKDKDYLNKFIKHSYCILSNEDSYHNYWPALPDNGTRSLYTGQLIRPMAEFVYMIKSDHELYITNLSPKASELANMYLSDPTQLILGYGDYANWLESRVIKCMDYMINNYWINNNACFRRYVGNNDPIEINFNASYASTMFFIGYTANRIDYTQKALCITLYFRDQVRGYPVGQIYQSYCWHHNYAGILKEDVSHCGIDIQIPIVGYTLYGENVYSYVEMNNFAHTFTREIWDRNNLEFHNNIYGLDGDIADGDIPCSDICYNLPNGMVNLFGLGQILPMMSLYLYDDENAEPNDIYSILLTQAVKLLTDDPTAFLPSGYWDCHSIQDPNLHNFTGTQCLYGLSEVVKAQWDKECVNLNLFNRDVVYDQDFKVKGKIVISPEEDYKLPSANPNNEIIYYQKGDLPFADPPFTDGGPNYRFVVEPGNNVTFKAGNSITFKAGTHLMVNTNSQIHAFIDNTLCQPGSKKPIVNNNYNGTYNGIQKDTLISSFNKSLNNITPNDSINKTSLIISPNPFSKSTKVSFTIGYYSHVKIKIMDVYGMTIKLLMDVEVKRGNYNITWNANNNSAGIYLCVFETEKESFTRKIILTKD